MFADPFEKEGRQLEISTIRIGRATALAVTLLVSDLESAGETRLVEAVEFQITGNDHSPYTLTSEPT
jgi:hypothetical protein